MINFYSRKMIFAFLLYPLVLIFDFSKIPTVDYFISLKLKIQKVLTPSSKMLDNLYLLHF